jgi:hypothetical protein
MRGSFVRQPSGFSPLLHRQQTPLKLNHPSMRLIKFPLLRIQNLTEFTNRSFLIGKLHFKVDQTVMQTLIDMHATRRHLHVTPPDRNSLSHDIVLLCNHLPQGRPRQH